MAAYKARGGKLGSARPGHWDGREHLRLAGVRAAAKAAGQSHSRAADLAYTDLYPIVAKLQAKGLTLREVAGKLYLTVNTVKAHTRNIYGKLGVHSRTAAVRRATDLGLL